MSDAPAPDAGKKKKGGKLPIIIVLAAVMAAGGFFGMKSRPVPVVKEPEAELGAVVPLTPEFVVNLRERNYFLRAEITLQMDKNSKIHLGGGGDGHGGKGGPAPEEIALRDAIQQRLSSMSIEDLKRPNFQQRLRRLIAADANHVLHIVAHVEEDPKDAKKDKKKEKEKKKEHHGPLTFDNVLEHSEDWEFPDWDSDEGPILKVYITSFATQRE